MRLLAVYLSLLLVIVAGAAAFYPISGGNGEVNCTVFGAYKNPLSSGKVSPGWNLLLTLDVGLHLQNQSPDMDLGDFEYTIVDRNDRIYHQSKEYSITIQPNRRLMAFVVPGEMIIKSLLVDTGRGTKFSLDWGPLYNSSNENATLLFYGVVGSREQSHRQYVDYDIGVVNNGTSMLAIGQENFTLKDQWGWAYPPSRGISPRILSANESMRDIISFGPMSPLSRPSQLEFRPNSSQLITLRIDSCPWTIPSEIYEEPILSGSPCCCAGAGQSQIVDPNSTKGKVLAAKERLSKVKETI